MQIINNYNSTEIFLFILNCFFSIIGSCLLIHLPSYLFYIDVREFRLLYNTIRENRGLEIFKDYDNIVKHRIFLEFSRNGFILLFQFIFRLVFVQLIIIKKLLFYLRLL